MKKKNKTYIKVFENVSLGDIIDILYKSIKLKSGKSFPSLEILYDIMFYRGAYQDFKDIDYMKSFIEYNMIGPSFFLFIDENNLVYVKCPSLDFEFAFTITKEELTRIYTNRVMLNHSKNN